MLWLALGKNLIVNQKSHLDDRLLLASNETKECAEHAEESEDSTNKGDTGFRVSLQSANRIRPCKRDELEGLVSEEIDGILGEGNFIQFLLILTREGILLCSLLEFMFNIESSRSKGVGVINGVSNVDTIKEDILSHGPKLNTDSALFIWVSR